VSESRNPKVQSIDRAAFIFLRYLNEVTGEELPKQSSQRFSLRANLDTVESSVKRQRDFSKLDGCAWSRGFNTGLDAFWPVTEGIQNRRFPIEFPFDSSSEVQMIHQKFETVLFLTRTMARAERSRVL
jgi:hypothetical protein